MKTSTNTIILFALAIASATAAAAGENCIYIGEDVGSPEGSHLEAIRVCADGTVTVHVGALIPGMHDPSGNPVRVKAIKSEKAKGGAPFVPTVVAEPVISDIAHAARIASEMWGVTIPVRGIRYGPSGTGCDGAANVLALTDYSTHIITINEKCIWDAGTASDALLVYLLTHEFGHLLMGPDHSLDPHSIMFTTVSLSGQVVTADDRKRLAATLDLSLAAMAAPSR
jgi:hypothetical protein